MRPIDGDALKRSLKEASKMWNNPQVPEHDNAIARSVFDFMAERIDDFPTIDIQAEVVKMQTPENLPVLICPKCLMVGHGTANYCPNCGAKLKEKENDIWQ